MLDIFEGQMCYVDFTYGLTFFVLASVSLVIRKPVKRRLPWIWLALFSVIAGISQLLSIYFNHISTEPLWLETIAFMFLLEFGRSGLVKLTGTGPGPWLMVPIAVLITLAWSSGTLATVSLLHFFIILIGGFWAAGVFVLAAKKNSLGKVPILFAGFISVLHTVLKLFISDDHGISWISFSNKGFSEVTGFPVEVIEGLMIMGIAGAIYLYQITNLKGKVKGSGLKSSYSTVIGACLLLFVIISLGSYSTKYVSQKNIDQLKGFGAQRAGWYANHFTRELNLHQNYAKTLSEDPSVYELLTSDKNEEQKVNSVLDSYKSNFCNTTYFLVDGNGRCIASTNRNSENSYLGEDFSSREFFQEILTGKINTYFISSNGGRKYYTSSPVTDEKDIIIGGIVMEQDTKHLEEKLGTTSNIFVIDNSGVVKLSGRPELISKDFPLLIAEGNSTQQSDKINTPIQKVQTIRLKSEVILDGKHYLVSQNTIDNNWKVIVLSEMGQVKAYRLFTISATLILSTTVLILFIVLERLRKEEVNIKSI